MLSINKKSGKSLTFSSRLHKQISTQIAYLFFMRLKTRTGEPASNGLGRIPWTSVTIIASIQA